MYKEYAEKVAKILEEGTATKTFLDTAELVKGENAVLGYLYKLKNGVHVNELKDVANVGSGRISDLINQLVKKDYVIKSKDQSDLRKTNVFITTKGIEYISNKHKIVIDSMSEQLTKLKIEEIQEFLYLLEKLVRR